MDWNGNLRNLNQLPRPSETSYNFLYSYNYDQLPAAETHQAMMIPSAGGGGGHQERMMVMNYGGGGNYASQQQQMMMMEKKKRLSNEQLESLERSFQEEIKLDPDRKMRLSRDLGLQPRQVAVWFQNRRARWKAKQLEKLYDSLKHEFDSVSEEKLKLQEEVMKLRGMLREQAARINTEVSGEETVDSTSVTVVAAGGERQMAAESRYLMSVEEYNNPVGVTAPAAAYWASYH